jgi:hypothetical protein
VRNFGGISFALLTALLFPAAFRGQTVPCLNAEKYELGSGLCIERKPVVVRRVRGRVVRADIHGYVWPDEKLPACLSLFAADSYEFVAKTSCDGEGRFDFGPIPSGKYRLIARVRGFPTGNSAVTVSHAPWLRNRRILVTFTCCAIDACTGVNYEHKQVARR